MIELRHLRYFIAVAEELHFGRAADRLHMAQPPLSQQIRQLEAELGFQLFHRTKRSVELTEAGQVFLKDCRKIFRQLDQAVRTGQQASRGELGQLAIAFVSSAAYNILPPILQAFRAAMPQVRLELHELTTDQQVRWMQDGRIDVGFVRPPVEDEQLQLMTIFREPLVVALPIAHPLAEQPQVSLAALASEPFILFPRPLAPGLYDQIISLCQQAEFSPTVVAGSDSDANDRQPSCRRHWDRDRPRLAAKSSTHRRSVQAADRTHSAGSDRVNLANSRSFANRAAFSGSCKASRAAVDLRSFTE